MWWLHLLVRRVHRSEHRAEVFQRLLCAAGTVKYVERCALLLREQLRKSESPLRWVDNIGEQLIGSYTVSIGGVDQPTVHLRSSEPLGRPRRKADRQKQLHRMRHRK
jgi:hypothetical protein